MLRRSNQRTLSRRSFLWNGLIFIPSVAIVQAQIRPRIRGGRIIPAAGGGGGGGNDVTFRSKNEVVGTGGNATVTEPAGATTNDILIALAACANAATLALPAGWTSIYNGTASTTFKYNLAWVRRGGSAPSLTWAVGSSVYREVMVFCYSGCVTSGNPYEASTDGGVTSTAQPDCPSVTTVNANAMVLAFAVQWNGSASGWGTPAGYTMRARNTAGDDLVMAEKKVAVAGAEDPALFSNGGAATTTWTASAALQD